MEGFSSWEWIWNCTIQMLMTILLWTSWRQAKKNSGNRSFANQNLVSRSTSHLLEYCVWTHYNHWPSRDTRDSTIRALLLTGMIVSLKCNSFEASFVDWIARWKVYRQPFVLLPLRYRPWAVLSLAKSNGPIPVLSSWVPQLLLGKLWCSWSISGHM